MLDVASAERNDAAVDFADLLRQAQASLDAAAAHVGSDPEAALDDILTARLLIATVSPRHLSVSPAAD